MLQRPAKSPSESLEYEWIEHELTGEKSKANINELTMSKGCSKWNEYLLEKFKGLYLMHNSFTPE